MEREKQIMEELNGKRRAYWYSKMWALIMVKNIEECGAEASFVNGVTLK